MLQCACWRPWCQGASTTTARDGSAPPPTSRARLPSAGPGLRTTGWVSEGRLVSARVSASVGVVFGSSRFEMWTVSQTQSHHRLKQKKGTNGSRTLLPYVQQVHALLQRQQGVRHCIGRVRATKTRGVGRGRRDGNNRPACAASHGRHGGVFQAGERAAGVGRRGAPRPTAHRAFRVMGGTARVFVRA